MRSLPTGARDYGLVQPDTRRVRGSSNSLGPEGEQRHPLDGSSGRVGAFLSVSSCKTVVVLTSALPSVTSAVSLDSDIEWSGLTALARKWAIRNDFSMPRQANQREAAVQVVDLFCGAGGLSTGFEVLGRRTGAAAIVGAADYDGPSLATYEANIGVVPTLVDLGSMARNPVEIKQFFSSMSIDHCRPKVLIGGPPCQGFTAHRKRKWSVSDVRNELVGAFATIATTFDPDVVVMENVPELLSERYWEHFIGFKTRLEEAGYFVTAQIHNLAEYGVAQERFRSLVIAAKSPLGGPEPILDRKRFRTVRQEIGHLPPIRPGEVCPTDPMHRCSRHKPETVRVIEQVAKNGGNRPKGVGPTSADKVDGFRDVYGRLSWDKPSVTITGYARNPASGRFVHPEQDRGLSLREAALLQGFPRNFMFHGPGDARFQQVGNAVPARFSLVLAAHVVRHLTDADYHPRVETGLESPARNSFSSSLPGLKGVGRS